MGVSSLTLGGLELLVPGTYGVSQVTLLALESAVLYDPVMVAMARRAPIYQRAQIKERPIPFGVFLLNPSAPQRFIDYQALLTASDTSLGLIALDWTTDGVTRRLLVFNAGFVPGPWFSNAQASLTAPDPTPVTV